MRKVHHSAIDGVSGAEILTAIHSLGAELDTTAITSETKKKAGNNPPFSSQLILAGTGNRLDLQVIGESMGTPLAAVTRLLVTAKGGHQVA